MNLLQWRGADNGFAATSLARLDGEVRAVVPVANQSRGFAIEYCAREHAIRCGAFGFWRRKST